MSDAPAVHKEHVADLREQVRLLAFEGLVPASDPGEVPDLAWISLSQLVVDERYQRKTGTETSKKLIRQIAEHLDWCRFAPISVARLPGASDKFAVIDGQHRALALAAHGGITEVPCWIVPAPEVKQQANAFIGLNRDRVAMQALSLHRAGLAAGDPEAVAVAKCCADAGIQIIYALPVKNGRAELPPRATQAIGAIKKAMQRHGAAIVTEALNVLARAYENRTNQLRGSMIASLAELLSAHGDRIDRARVVKVLAERDADQLAAAARNMKSLLGCTTTAAMSEAILKSYDRGLNDTKRLSPARSAEPAAPGAVRPEEPAEHPAPPPMPVSALEPPSKARLMAGR